MVQQHLIKCLDYDIWATNQWLGYIENVASKHLGAQLATHAEKWLRHSEGCYRNWLDLITGQSTEPSDCLRTDLSARFTEIGEVILTVDLASIRVRPSNGATRSVIDIIQHMLNHSTYHRGQLRGLAEQAGLTDWPETDYCLFVCLES